MAKYTYFILLVIIVSGCIKQVSDEFPVFEAYTTVNSLLKVDSLITIHVATTGKLGGDSLSVSENAELNLFVNDEFYEKVHYVANGLYQSTIRASPLTTYRCEVLLNNKLAKTQCTLPVATQLQNVKLYPKAWVNNEGRALPAISFSIKNDTTQTLYFEVRVKILDGFGSDKYYYSDEYSLLLFTNANELAKTINKYIEIMLYNWGSNMKNAYLLELRSVNESYYNYAQSVILYEQGRYPEFNIGTAPAYNLHSNVENGYGIFAGYSRYISDTLFDSIY